jgi:hypothetical protein
VKFNAQVGTIRTWSVVIMNEDNGEINLI